MFLQLLFVAQLRYNFSMESYGQFLLWERNDDDVEYRDSTKLLLKSSLSSSQWVRTKMVVPCLQRSSYYEPHSHEVKRNARDTPATAPALARTNSGGRSTPRYGSESLCWRGRLFARPAHLLNQEARTASHSRLFSVAIIHVLCAANDTVVGVASQGRRGFRTAEGRRQALPGPA